MRHYDLATKSFEDIGMKQAKYDKHGPLFTETQLLTGAVNLINTNYLFERKAKMISTDIEKAESHLETAITTFRKQYNQFNQVEELFSSDAKKAASSVKDAEEKLLQGLARVEKAANFERLNRYVELLERAATAMNQLAALEKEGRLDKIASAIR
jgi:phage shock protein A